MISFTKEQIAEIVVDVAVFYFFGIWIAIFLNVVRIFFRKSKIDTSSERQEIIRLQNENQKLKLPIVDSNTINHMEYLANDPDLELFKARCRARGEVF